MSIFSDIDTELRKQSTENGYETIYVPLAVIGFIFLLTKVLDFNLFNIGLDIIFIAFVLWIIDEVNPRKVKN